ncbi:unannotated protein [freshwater metagenome]|uniref:Unannotated protein n=1 Tax=freshwater metagenome TaxID=449393 RepID=A0A6J6Z8X7_9ZZZZ
MLPSAIPCTAAYATINPGRIVLLKVLTIARPKPTRSEIKTIPPPRLSVHAKPPAISKTPSNIPVRVTTSSIVMRPVRADDAAGAL